MRVQPYGLPELEEFQGRHTYRHILVVDDDAFIVKLIQEDLGLEGYNVSSASDGQAALQLAKKTKPNLVILDVNMPMINGLKTMEYLRGLEETKNIPILFLSGESSSRLAPALASVPRVSYIKKPVDLEDLHSIIHHLLEKYPT